MRRFWSDSISGVAFSTRILPVVDLAEVFEGWLPVEAHTRALLDRASFIVPKSPGYVVESSI